MKRILELYMSETRTIYAEMDLIIVTLTEGYNGSDLKDACKDAVLGPNRDLLASGNLCDTSVKVNFVRKTHFDIPAQR